MRQANFIVGFNNWGKSTIIFKLFGQSRFNYHLTYQLDKLKIPMSFVVQSQSNDDIGQEILTRLKLRLNKTKKTKPDIFATLCPSMDKYNNFIEILQDNIFVDFDKINLFLIKYKWEHHAELMIDEIKKKLQDLPKINYITIDSDKGLSLKQGTNAKVSQIRNKLVEIYS